MYENMTGQADDFSGITETFLSGQKCVILLSVKCKKK